MCYVYALEVRGPHDAERIRREVLALLARLLIGRTTLDRITAVDVFVILIVAAMAACVAIVRDGVPTSRCGPARPPPAPVSPPTFY